jgi:hypothetical protein
MSILLELENNKFFKEIAAIHTLFFFVEILIFMAGLGAALYAILLDWRKRNAEMA